LEKTFSIGICASGNAAGLSKMVNTLLHEIYPTNAILKKIVVVASGCTRETLLSLEELKRKESKLVLIVEDRRYGKARAMNRILELCNEDIIVFVNSDAFPECGTVKKLVEELLKNKTSGVVSASPSLPKAHHIAARIGRLIWLTHNISCLFLNHKGLLNHACDEVFALRREIVSSLPEDTVNDGSFIGGLAHQKGYKIKFKEDAKVRIKIAENIASIFSQRRRIIYGHIMVWKRIGTAPSNVEFLSFKSPNLSFRILLDVLKREPSQSLVMPFVVLEEFLAFFAAFLDFLSRKNPHTIWKRYQE
jgi:biofilm PGA synthesis N-glycosyltransferase PgaC